MTSASEEKRRTFNGFFSPGTGSSATGIDPENRMCDEDTGSPGRPVSCGLQVPLSRAIVAQEQDTLVDLPSTFFPSK